eukprot:35165-Rhodomonas_salina.1
MQRHSMRGVEGWRIEGVKPGARSRACPRRSGLRLPSTSRCARAGTSRSHTPAPANETHPTSHTPVLTALPPSHTPVFTRRVPVSSRSQQPRSARI